MEPAILGLVLQAPLTEYTFCVNDDCIAYMCGIGPSYTVQDDTVRVHTPCLPLNMVCNDVVTEVCVLDEIVIEEMPNKQGIIIYGGELNEK